VKPRLSLTLPCFGTFYAPGELPRILDFARAADAAGIDGLKVPEHVVLGRDVSRYRWGAFPYPPDVPWLEPMVTIGALAAATDQIALETGILIAPLRSAIVLAKQAATADLLSRGRLVLGVGSGWQPAELEAGGVPYAERHERLDETIAACRVLWQDSPASFDGRFERFHEVFCEPRPVRPGGVPIWLAGPPTEATFARVAALADGWMPPPAAPPERVLEAMPRFRAALSSHGRDPERFDVATALLSIRDADGRASLELTLAEARRLGAAGVTVVSLFAESFGVSPADAPAWIANLGRTWHGE
jgi:probable F420-dependent oxidoreductase